jgi:hypothetical protein
MPWNNLKSKKKIIGKQYGWYLDIGYKTPKITGF